MEEVFLLDIKCSRPMCNEISLPYFEVPETSLIKEFSKEIKYVVFVVLTGKFCFLWYIAVYSVGSRALFSTCFSRPLLDRLILDPEDGGDLFFRNVSLLPTDCTVLYPTRKNSSKWNIIPVGSFGLNRYLCGYSNVCYLNKVCWPSSFFCLTTDW